jgi:2-polyprenyl-6-methoxyphenol hydroxylase-like FAD-dependent oxidoreductase/predicted DsbA family dithiol-disulfide isomerase
MKVVIIGGGIAGLTLGAFLREKDIEVVVNERCAETQLKGHAFLMHSDGISVLNQLNAEKKSFLNGKIVDTYSLRRPEGNEIKHIQLNSWRCIKRTCLVGFLSSLLPAEIIKKGREFSHFMYKGDKAVAAVFRNGEVEYGDIFIGADGGNSKVRESLFGKVESGPVKVKEIVGVSYNSNVAKSHSSTFTKFQHKTKGLAFGFIPTSEVEFVWFLQYDPRISDLTDKSPVGIQSFCADLLKDFPPVVREILNTNDFDTSYIWNTRDFDLLPSFHKDNIALIGDAAHLALPFTSAGTTNAILDASTITEQLVACSNYSEAFESYYQIRSEEVGKHTLLGRELQSIFLNPTFKSDDDIPVPLISEKKKTTPVVKEKQLQVLYFTDPICSTCWIIQPLLRRLKLEYGKYLNVEYRMGGLLPSWELYNKGKISKPTDAAKHWEEVCACHEMPLDGDVWLEDPLSSSYPPSIAFKAAQLQDNDLAILFLRRIKEMVFLEKKNIIKWEFLERAAFEVGLDSARLLRDFEGKAKELFKDDLIMAQKLGVTSFPTLFFCDNLNNCYTIKGFQPYESFEEIIKKLSPAVKKELINTNPQSLFTHFPTMAEKEFAFLSNIPIKSANEILTELFRQGSLDKYESKNGVIWKSKFAEST